MLFDKKIGSVSGDVTDIDPSEVVFFKQIVGYKVLTSVFSITCGKLRLAIWDTFFWTFWLKFGHKGP